MARTTITPAIIEECKKLAEKGFTNVMISKALNINTSTLSKNRKLIQAIQEGKSELAKIVTNSILDALDETQHTLFIAKRLNLFNPQINIRKPINASEALENLSIAIKQYADGEINESQLRTIEAVSNSYIKAYEFTEFEQRLMEVEDAINQQKES